MAGVPPTELDRAYRVSRHATDAAVSGDLPDRRGAIRALGIIQIVIGAICALMAAGMVVAKNKVQAGSITYGVATVNLLVTGIGSVRLAPSARRATIISATTWLVLVGISRVAFIYRTVVGRGYDFSGRSVATGLGFAAVMAFLVSLPVVLIAVYTRPSVRATFERNQAS